MEESLYTKAAADPVDENTHLATESPMPAPPLPPEQLAEAKALAQAIREATDDEINELARTLVATEDQHLFGDNEFQIRAIAHRIAAKAVERHLAQKKMDTTAPR